MALIEKTMTLDEAMEMGIEAFARKDLKSAHMLFKAVTDAAPDDSEARFYLARILNLTGKVAEADAEFDRAVADGLHEDYVDYYNGVRALREKRYADAERLADAILARDPDDDDARMMGVRALAMQNRWEDAAAKYGRQAAEELADDSFGKNALIHPFAISRIMEKFSADKRKEVDEKLIQPNAKLTVLLKKVPADWVHSIAAHLGFPKRRKVADAIADVAGALATADGLRKAIADLSADERAALRFLLDQGGVASRQAFSRKFGDDKEDSYWVGEHPPTSTLGRLRDRGLVFVGRAPSAVGRGYALVVPAEEREELRKLV